MIDPTPEIIAEDHLPNLVTIKVDDLTVGEYDAMVNAGRAWAVLQGLDQSYLAKLIARLEGEGHKNTKLSLPVFKMILFFAIHLEEHMLKSHELSAAIEKMKEDSDREKFMANQVVPLI